MMSIIFKKISILFFALFFVFQAKPSQAQSIFSILPFSCTSASSCVLSAVGGFASYLFMQYASRVAINFYGAVHHDTGLKRDLTDKLFYVFASTDSTLNSTAGAKMAKNVVDFGDKVLGFAAGQVESRSGLTHGGYSVRHPGTTPYALPSVQQLGLSEKPTFM